MQNCQQKYGNFSECISIGFAYAKFLHIFCHLLYLLFGNLSSLLLSLIFVLLFLRLLNCSQELCFCLHFKFTLTTLQVLCLNFVCLLKFLDNFLDLFNDFV